MSGSGHSKQNLTPVLSCKPFAMGQSPPAASCINLPGHSAPATPALSFLMAPRVFPPWVFTLAATPPWHGRLRVTQAQLSTALLLGKAFPDAPGSSTPQSLFLTPACPIPIGQLFAHCLTHSTNVYPSLLTPARRDTCLSSLNNVSVSSEQLKSP